MKKNPNTFCKKTNLWKIGALINDFIWNFYGKLEIGNVRMFTLKYLFSVNSFTWKHVLFFDETFWNVNIKLYFKTEAKSPEKKNDTHYFFYEDKKTTQETLLCKKLLCVFCMKETSWW